VVEDDAVPRRLAHPVLHLGVDARLVCSFKVRKDGTGPSSTWRFQYWTDATFSESHQISPNASVCGTNSSAQIADHLRATRYAGRASSSMGAGGVITFRLMSPHPTIVVDPASMIARITVLRSFFKMPWIWNACRVVARRSFWPYLSHRSSRTRYSGPGHSPLGTLRRSMNCHAFSAPFFRFSRSSCW